MSEKENLDSKNTFITDSPIENLRKVFHTFPTAFPQEKMKRKGLLAALL